MTRKVPEAIAQARTGIGISGGDPLAELEKMPAFTLGQLGQSLDGHIATRTGDSKYINHKQGLIHLHRLRSIVDAVLVGVGTVNDDDPLLTVRLCAGKSPVRVIVDPRGRVFEEAKLFRDGGPEVIILTAKNICHPMSGRARIVGLELRDDRLPPEEMLAAMAEIGLRKILVEGGSRTLSSFIDHGCLDRLHLIVAPLLIGGGYPGLALSAINRLEAAIRPAVTLYPLGHDVLFDCDLTSVRG